MKLAPLAVVALTLLLAVAGANCVPAAAPADAGDALDASAPHRFGMVNVPPVINPSWGGVSRSPDGGGPLVWYINPQSTVATCSDATNTGLSSSSPLCTWHELHDHIWACGAGLGYGGEVCPRFKANVTIVFNSSQTVNTDPVYFSPMLEQGAIVTLQGALGATQVSATGTLLSRTAKNRATPTLLKSTFTGADGGTSSFAAGMLVANSTHASRAWSYYNNAGTISFSQPLAAVTLPFAIGTTPAEVDTWANSDAITIYTPVNIDLVRFAPVVAQGSYNGTNFAGYLYQVNVWDPQTFDAGLGPDMVTLNHEVAVVESSSAKSVNVVGFMAGATDWINAYMGQVTATTEPLQLTIAGGVIGTQAGATTSSFFNTVLDGDVILGGTGSAYIGGALNAFGAGSQLGLVYVDTSATLGVSGGIVDAEATYSGGPIVWGPGTLNVAGQGRLVYPAGAGKAATTFPVTTLKLNGGALYCLGAPLADAGKLLCNGTLSAANLDTSLGTTVVAGCGFNPGGGGYCNGGY